MNKIPKLIIQKHSYFNVVRGDLSPGGIKAQCLTPLLAEDIREQEVVYCAHAYGHSGFALGLSGLYTGKKVTLFLTGPEADTYIQRQARSLNNVECIVLYNIKHQSQLVNLAKQYANEHGAHYLPIGFNCDPCNKRMIALAQSLPVDPKEVWVSGGSGTTSRCLVKAWPKAVINTVNLGMMPNADMGTNNVYFSGEDPETEAVLPPPYPSARYYDAKIWRFVKEHASKGSLIWNIA